MTFLKLYSICRPLVYGRENERTRKIAYFLSISLSIYKTVDLI